MRLSHLVAAFHTDVKAGRQALRADAPGVLTGATFFADKAIETALPTASLLYRNASITPSSAQVFTHNYIKHEIELELYLENLRPNCRGGKSFA